VSLSASYGKGANDRHNQHHRHCDGVTVVSVKSEDLDEPEDTATSPWFVCEIGK